MNKNEIFKMNPRKKTTETKESWSNNDEFKRLAINNLVEILGDEEPRGAGLYGDDLQKLRPVTLLTIYSVIYKNNKRKHQ